MMFAYSCTYLSTTVNTDLLSSPTPPPHHKSRLEKQKRGRGYYVVTDLRLERPFMNKWEET